MDVEIVRTHAEAYCAALLAGDIGLASEAFSEQLRANIGESDDIRIETRWKDRDGRPTLVEASHVIERIATPPPEEGADSGA